ncbi:MAG: Gfo/Idh/MocA family oxidoreductase [Actinomycetota bacterium]
MSGPDQDASSGTSVGIGVLGGGSFVARRAVLPAIDAAHGAHLVAISSRSGSVAAPWADRSVPDYTDVLAHPEVDAVYLPLPNGLHEEWTIKAAIAGKHVLCEKPLAPTCEAAVRMADACRAHGVLLAEAWMTPFDLRWQRILADVESGVIGEVDRVDARFTFTIVADGADNYRWIPEQGGGALLDVGIYTLGLPTALWGTDVEQVIVRDRISAESGVDARTDAELVWPDGRRAHIVCSFVDDEVQRVSVAGSGGAVTANGDAFTGGAAARDHHVATGESRTVSGPGGDPYVAMVEAFARSVRGDEAWPRPIDDAVAMLRLLERIEREPVTP